MNHVAARGERLALVRLHCGEAPAFTMELLVVYELDGDGRLVREADFDDDEANKCLIARMLPGRPRT